MIHQKEPEWLRIEQALCSNSSLQARCNSPGKVSKLIYNNHFVIGQSLKYTLIPQMYDSRRINCI